MDVDTVLRESQEMTGPLGAVAFVVLQAIAAGGASAAEVDTTRDLLFRCCTALTDEQSNVLAEFVHQRLKDRPDAGLWYG